MLRLARVAVAAVALALAAVPAAASAAPMLNGTFDVNGTPGPLTLGPDGNVYFQVSGNSDNKELGRIAANGTITYFDTPNDVAVAGLTAGPSKAGGSNDRVWLSQNGGVVAWNPATSTGTAFPIATIGGARGIARDAEGDLWVVDDADGLVEVAPDGNKKQDVGVAGSSGRDIAAGSDGRVWWADFGGQSIRATPTTGLMPTTEAFAVGGGPQGIGAGPAGQLAYANPGTVPQTVGRISTGGSFQPTKTTGGADPFGVAFGADGAYWFPQFATNNLGRLTRDGKYTTPITVPAGSGPRKITIGAGNTLWVSLETSKKIARITGVDPPSGGGGTGGGGTGGGAGADGGGDTRAPKIRSARVTPKRLAAGAKTKLTFELSESSSVSIRIERAAAGRIRKGSCVKPSSKLADAAKCTRYVRVRTVAAQRA